VKGDAARRSPLALTHALTHVLHPQVAENNIVMSDIISKLGVHERFDVAWREAKYGGY
jgi:hypothetical protein